MLVVDVRPKTMFVDASIVEGSVWIGPVHAGVDIDSDPEEASRWVVPDAVLAGRAENKHIVVVAQRAVDAVDCASLLIHHGCRFVSVLPQS
jgi:hypothetical protein